MRRILSRVLAACVLTFLLQTASAEAKGFFLVTYGDSVMHVAEVPADQKATLRAMMNRDVALGLHYSYFGVFWLDLWTWGGQWSLYNGNSYWKLTPQQAAAILHTTPDKLKKPFRYTFPLGLVIPGVLLGGFMLFGAVWKSDADRVAALRRDPRYVRAIELFVSASPAHAFESEEGRREAFDRAFAVARQHLIEQGVSPKTADKNLMLVLKPLAPVATVAGPVPSTNSLLR